MSKDLFISTSPHETKVAVLEDDQLVEVYYERDTDVGLVGGIYKGRVSRVLPGMQSAFVDIGLERDAFLYVSDFFLEDQDEYDKIFEEAEVRAGPGTTEGPAAPAAQPPLGGTSVSEPAKAAAPEAPAAGARETSEPAPEKTVAPPTVPAEASATGVPTFTPNPPSAKPHSGPSDYKRHEFRGRGRRKRRGGRPFNEHRFVPKQDFEASRPLEVLPGESLAKYSRLAPEARTTTETEKPTESDAVETPSIARPVVPVEPGMTEAAAPPPPFSSAPLTACSEHEAVSSSPKVPGEGAIFAGEGSATPSRENFSAQPRSTDYEKPKGHVPSVTASEPESPVRLNAPEARAFPTREGVISEAAYGLETAPAARPAEAARESVAEPGTAVSVPAEVTAPPTPPATPETLTATDVTPTLQPRPAGQAEGEATPAEPAPGQTTTTAEPAGGEAVRTYTIREPHQRPRFAPRRGRRGPRGMGQGRPPGRHDPSRTGNQAPRPIAEMLKEGQEILVQIAKEPLGTKGARITSHIALPGRYGVYMPTINHIGVSRKISSEEERLRLRNIILENKGSMTGGFIVRTAGSGRSEDEFKADLKFLGTTWNEIRAKADQVKAPALVHRDLDLVQRLLRDVLTPDFKSVRVDNEADYERVLDFMNRCQPSLVGAVKLHTRDTPLFEEYGVQAEIEKALKPKVWLKSGGYIVLNQTEALVAIDVNTGKYVGKTNRLEDTILKTNIDAVKEIVRQIRLRDLGGIIVIDFIDMDERKNRFKVIQALEEALRHDRAPTKIVSFNEFGLVAITRKRVKQSLERTLCEPCNYCTGAGWIKSTATVCYEILAEARKMAGQIEGKILTLRVNPEVALVLKSRDGVLITEIESLTHKEVVIKSDPAVHQERFEIF